MSLDNPFRYFAWGNLFDSLLPDFVLAFAFFTALIYAVLGKRFGHQRSAVAASAALGFALSMGLVWWERQNGLSVRNLGPWAVGFAVIILAGIMYQAIKQTGGSWAGGGIAVGASLLIATLVGLRWPAAQEVIQTVMIVTLVGGVVAFLLHQRSHPSPAAVRADAPAIPLFGGEFPIIEREARDMPEERAVSNRLGCRFRDMKKKSDHLHEHPRDAEDIMLQLRRMLPAEGWLTERLSKLRVTLHHIKEGEGHRIEKLQSVFGKLPDAEKARVAQGLQQNYRELKLDVRLDRLERAVAENERRIIELTQQAEASLASHDYRALHDILKAAEKLQKHNSQLFKLIDGTEKKIMAIGRRLAKAQGEVKGK